MVRVSVESDLVTESGTTWVSVPAPSFEKQVKKKKSSSTLVAETDPVRPAPTVFVALFATGAAVRTVRTSSPLDRSELVTSILTSPETTVTVTSYGRNRTHSVPES